MPDLYFNRVPSLPATDDGSAKPLAEDLNTRSGDGEDVTWDVDMAGTDGVPAEAGPDARPVMAGPEDEPEFAEADAFLPASPETASAPGRIRRAGPGSERGSAVTGMLRERRSTRGCGRDPLVMAGSAGDSRVPAAMRLLVQGKGYLGRLGLSGGAEGL